MATAAVTWFIITILITSSSSQTLSTYKKLPNQGICRGAEPYGSLKLFYEAYKDCSVIVGNLLFTLLERTKKEHFVNVSFPNLREVTGFFVIYRVNELKSLGQLFPNLARIRGEQVVNNFGLIIDDVPSLEEIGLYNLLKIDRGGVIIRGVPKAHFVVTVDWSRLSPRSRHVIDVNFKEERAFKKNSNFTCSCSLVTPYNKCWSKKYCQIMLDGPEKINCNDQCIGCRKTNSKECSICRHYTYNGQCLLKCPENTIILRDCQYCITVNECKNLSGWVFNNTCVFHCPIGFAEKHTGNETVCEPCPDCDKICVSQVIQSTRAIQAAEKCVIINGSLEIHIRFVPEAMDELRAYLGRIEEVTDYILIYGSNTITSLDFLPSLKKIHGKKLKDGKYSLAIYDMVRLQSLFSLNVIKYLKIENGTLKIYNNPMLCMSKIEKIKPLFPVPPNDVDLPPEVNGYSGSCDNLAAGFQVSGITETVAYVTIYTPTDPNAHYSVLYVRLPYGTNETLVPEQCSEYEWYSVNVNAKSGIVKLTSLYPGSTYAICIETYNPVLQKLGRSKISKFTTPVGTPEPPFIIKLAANDSESIEIRWLDHIDYHSHIRHYELDVTLIENFKRDIMIKDQWQYQEVEDFEISRHVVVMRPPPEYGGCESMCDVLSKVTAGAMVEEYFDVCASIQCDVEEETITANTSIAGKLKTLVLNIPSKENTTKVRGLAPYHDYKFRLRACTDKKCSRSATGVVRTYESEKADIALITQVDVTEYGNFSITWKPPNITNGPILSYFVEILPKFGEDQFVNIMSQKWCISANETSHAVNVLPAEKYLVKVCTRTMLPMLACNETIISVNKTKMPVKPKIAVIDTSTITSNHWWLGIVFGIVLYASSVVVGYRKQRRDVDLEPIISSESSLRNESEPPINILSDFSVMYSVPLRDTQLDS